MKSIKSVLETEAIFSEDKMHRYLLKKTWDIENKRSQSLQCTRIMMVFSISI